MKWLRNIGRLFAREQRGVAVLEFALSLPFLVSMLLGAIEMTRYVLINQKVDKISYTIADLVGQSQTASMTELNNLMLAAGQVMQPYSFTASGYVIISSVTQTGTYSITNPPVVNWQYSGGGTMLKSSNIGTTGGPATLPAGFTLNSGDNVIVAEVFYQFAPLINTVVISNIPIYRTAIYKPRLGALTTLSSS